jgi:glutathione peroxidase
MRTILLLAVVYMGVTAMVRAGVAAEAVATSDAKPEAPVDSSQKTGPLGVTMKTLDGKEVNLAKKYKGKVVLLVNVASECGLTGQYEPLQALHAKYADDGLAIVGVPCNQFNSQEPGTSAEIAEFCKANYGVEFDLLSKVEVNGEKAVPLYAWLTSKEKNPKFAGPIKWNFEKFLINRDGQVVARFEPRVRPESPEVVKAIEAELAKKGS